MGRAMKHAGGVLLLLVVMMIFGCARSSPPPEATYDYDLCDRVQRHPTNDNINERVRCAKNEERMLATSER